MSEQDSIRAFKEKLDQEHEWPTTYMFKFIVPHGKEDEVRQLFPKTQVTTKASREGKYVSVTSKMYIRSADEVVEIYQKAKLIEGIISL